VFVFEKLNLYGNNFTHIMLCYIDYRQAPAIFQDQRPWHFQYLCGCEC
jgi:hypothetical protein